MLEENRLHTWMPMIPQNGPHILSPDFIYLNHGPLDRVILKAAFLQCKTINYLQMNVGRKWNLFLEAWAQQHSSFMFYLIFLSIHDASKIQKKFSWPRVHRWEKWSQSGKMLPGGRTEIENIKSAKSNIFNFNSATRWHFWTLNPFFPSMDPWS